jgi:hypothetical protein
MATSGNHLDVKLSLGFNDVGLEVLTDHLLSQPSSLARARLFRELALRSWHGILPSYPQPSAEQESQWLQLTARIPLSLRLRDDDLAAQGLYRALAALPNNNTRAITIKRLLHKALHQPRPAGPAAHAPEQMFSAFSGVSFDSGPSSGSTRTSPAPAQDPDSITAPAAMVAASEPTPEPAPLVPFVAVVEAPTPVSAETPPQQAGQADNLGADPAVSQKAQRGRKALLANFFDQPL